MSGLVEKVLEKTRGRSRSRKSSLRNPDRPAAAELPEIVNASAISSQDLSRSTAPGMAPPSLPAWHVHTGARATNPDPPVPSSIDQSSRMAHSSLPTTNAAPQASHAQQQMPQMSTTERIPARSSSLRPRLSGSEYTPVEGPTSDGISYPYTVARRRESGSHDKKHHRHSRSIGHKTRQEAGETQRPVTAPHAVPHLGDQLPTQAAGTDLSTEIDQALSSLSIQEHSARPVTTSGQPRDESTPSTAHLRLPPGFNMGNTEQTYIDTEWKPAVTHENIHHERTEILQEAVTRDIHIHHYYTYVQPIKVVEVLPAKHYRLDERTGIKTEIPAPEGWVMPPHLHPYRQDTSDVKAWTRHYLVNEQHPYGVPEPPSQPPRLPDTGRDYDLSDSVLKQYQPLQHVNGVHEQTPVPPASERRYAFPQPPRNQPGQGNTTSTHRPASQPGQSAPGRRNYSVSHPMLSQYVHRSG